MRTLLLLTIALVACSSHDKDSKDPKESKESKDHKGSAAAGAAGAAADPPSSGAPSADHPVTLHLTTKSVELKSKAGSHTFQVESAKPTPELVQPIVDEIFAAGGKGGITVWGRYEAPDVWNALAPALYDVPTTICLRDGSNC
jgi:hypothetical protein